MTFLYRLFRKKNRTSTQRSAKQSRSLIDALERRQFLSASVSLTPVITQATEGTSEFVAYDIVKTGSDPVRVEWETQHVDTDDFDGLQYPPDNPGYEDFPAGNWTRRVEFAPWDDHQVEHDEAFKIKIRPSSNYTIQGSGTADGKILNDDFSVHIVGSPVLTAGAIDDVTLETRDADGQPFPNGDFQIVSYDGIHINPQLLDLISDGAGRVTLPIMGLAANPAAWFQTFANGGLFQQLNVPVENPQFTWLNTKAAVDGVVKLRVKVLTQKGEPLKGKLNANDDPNNDKLGALGSNIDIDANGIALVPVIGVPLGNENLTVTVAGTNASSTQNITVEVPRIAVATDLDIYVAQGDTKELVAQVLTSEDRPVSDYALYCGWETPGQQIASIEQYFGPWTSEGGFVRVVIKSQTRGNTRLEWTRVTGPAEYTRVGVYP